jgi:hypothetical protein
MLRRLDLALCRESRRPDSNRGPLHYERSDAVLNGRQMVIQRAIDCLGEPVWTLIAQRLRPQNAPSCSLVPGHVPVFSRLRGPGYSARS